MNREAWLQAAIIGLAPLFAAAEIEIPQVRISVGFPGGPGRKDNVIGQCWNSHAASDKIHQIFIHPKLSDVTQILGVIMHEIVHAVDDCQHGHKGPFVKMIRALGLEGKPTATVVGEELAEQLKPILDSLGEYPHGALAGMTAGGDGGGKKQTTRMLKVVCGSDPEYKVRTTRKMLDEYGAPSCPCHGEVMEEADL